jgi:hypothetical protein
MSEHKIEKQIFTYPFFFRFVFRYGNIFVTILLVIYSFPLIIYIDSNLLLIIPLAINFFLIYYLNKRYLSNYKIFPFSIEADNERIICSNFFLSKKEIVVYYSNISSLIGGSFENKYSGIMKVYSENNTSCIAFHNRLINSSLLVTYILSKVNKKLYDEVLDKIKVKSGRK